MLGKVSTHITAELLCKSFYQICSRDEKMHHGLVVP